MPSGDCGSADRKVVTPNRQPCRACSENEPVQTSNAKPADELAWTVKVHDLGAAASDPALKNLKYVRTEDRILLIDPPSRVVVGEVKG